MKKLILGIIIVLLVAGYAFGSSRIMTVFFPTHYSGSGVDLSGTYWETARTPYWTDARTSLWTTARNTELP